MGSHTPSPSDPSRGTNLNSPWLASLVLARHSLRARAAVAWARFSTLPRPRRERIARRAAMTLGGAALLLALGLPLVWADGDNTINVVNGEVGIANNGKCSLIEAIRNANDTKDGRPHADCAAGDPKGADTIVLPQGGEFILMEASTNGTWGPNGVPWITSEVVLNANESVIRRKDGAPPFRLLAVGVKGKLTINKATLNNGHAVKGIPPEKAPRGGAVLSHGSLTIVSSTLSGNFAEDGYGGAIGIVTLDGMPSAATLVMKGSVVSGNSADHGGGGIDGLYAELTVKDSTIAANQSSMAGGIGNWQGHLELDTVSVTNNVGTYAGGGIASTGTANIRNSQITSNTGERGGGIALETPGTSGFFPNAIADSVISRNFALLGGGLYLSAHDTTVTTTIVSDNFASEGGGGVDVTSSLELDQSSITGNRTDGNGGGLNMEQGTYLSMSKSTIGQNSSSNNGGGLHCDLYSVCAIRQSTFTGNFAADSGGGIASNAYFGWVSIEGSTFTSNTARRGKGGGIHISDGTLGLARTLVAGNVNQNGQDEVAVEAWVEASGTHNLIGHDGISGASGYQLGASDIVPSVPVQLILDTVAKNNGGTTVTHALKSGSPAVDAAPSQDCTGKTDQRGFPRNYNGSNGITSNECDIGSFEFGSQPNATNTPVATATSKPTRTPSPTATAKPTKTPTPTATAKASRTPTMTPSPTITVTPGATVTVTALPTATPTRPASLLYRSYIPVAVDIWVP